MERFFMVINFVVAAIFVGVALARYPAAISPVAAGLAVLNFGMGIYYAMVVVRQG